VTILVTGATGHIGSHVVAGLAAAGARVRAVARGEADVPAGVELVRADLTDAEALGGSLDDVDAAFLLRPPATAVGHQRPVDLIASRVERVVYLSSVSVETAPDHPMTAIHADIERRLTAESDAWTFLRVGKLDTNAFGYAAPIRETGQVRLPYPELGRAPIHERDVAAVAVRVLLDDRWRGRALVPSGPEALTEGDIVRTIGEVVGRPARVVQITPEESRAEMLDAGVAPDLADAALEYWRGLVDEPEPLTSVVQEVTGGSARTFASWVAENAAGFA
jgi:uncharacterized protein YbjT (DUF2867 family)